MATSYVHITPEQAALIRESPLFFIASASPDLSPGPGGQGPVNLSPKGGCPLHVIDENRVAYLDYAGSGNETSRHSLAGGPVTIMVMSIGKEDAAIVRLYGHATVTPQEDSPLADIVLSAPAEHLELTQRQVVDIAVESTATSCGYGVPVFQFVSQRVRAERGRRFKQS